MGGGDLNQKKSWHPQTLKNQEKVWKAEQAKNQELKRVNELRKEIDAERNREELKRIGHSSGVLSTSDADKKLEWMYKSSTELINREEYLLGRSVDKSFEILQEEEKKKNVNLNGMKQPINHVEHECIPFSIRDYRNAESSEQVDLQRKIMEDPLMLIKQREMESRRKILENPVKLKELHRILKTDRQLEVKKKKSKKSKKKKSIKKHKKRRASSSDSSDSSNESSESGGDLDAKLAKKYKQIKGGILNDGEDGKNLSLTKLLDAKYETISKELDKAVKGKRKKKSRRHRSTSSEDDDGRSSRQKRKHDTSRTERRSRTRSISRKQFYERPRNRERSRSRSARRRHESRNRTRSPKLHRSIREASPPKMQKRVSKSPHKKHDVGKSRPDSKAFNKLTEEEKEARRREMMENATWRETDRTQAVKRHRDAYSLEENQNKAREFDKNFINKEVGKAIANQSSVGSRIRSNLNNIQRSSSSMDTNFARK